MTDLSSHNLKIILAGICSTMIAIGLGRFIYTPILPNMQSNLILSSTTMGIISSYNYFGYLIGSMIPILYKFNNPRNVIIFSSTISVITIFLMGFTTKVELFIVLRFLCGVSSAFGFVFTISLMFNQFQDSYNKSLQLIHFCGIGLGIVIGTSVIWVISVMGNLWNDQWIVIGIIGVILCIPIIMFTPKNLDVLNSKSIPIKVKLKANFITISFGYFFFGIGYIIFGTFISAMVKSSFESSFFQYFSWVIVGLFAIPSVIIWDWVAKKISRDLLLFFSCSTVTLGISFLDTKERDLNYLISLNIKSVINITKSVVQKMLDKKIKGSIINVSSQMGHVGAVNRTTYCTTKFAIEGFTKSLSIELAPYGIRVNSICPTFVRTPMTDPFLQDKKFKKEVLSKIPLKRLGRIEDVMGSFVFLASESSSLITGISLLVDGGWTAQ